MFGFMALQPVIRMNSKVSVASLFMCVSSLIFCNNTIDRSP